MIPHGKKDRQPPKSSEMEMKFHLLYDTMLQGVVFQDAVGKIVSMNPAAEGILVRSPEEFVGSSSVDQQHATIHDDGTPFPGLEHPAMVALRTGKEVRDVTMGVYDHREEAYRWIVISAVPLFHPGEERPYLVYTIFNDITERKRSEEALKESESKYRGLYENIGQPVGLRQLVFDSNGEAIDQILVDANPLGVKEIGADSIDDVRGMRYSELFSPETARIALEDSKELIAAGRPITKERHHDFNDRYYQVTSILLGKDCILSTNLDITDIKRAQREAEESKERFRALADNVSQLEWMADETGSIFWYNKQWYDYTGTTPEQMDGWGWQSVHNPEVLPNVLEQWKGSIATGQPFKMVFPLRGADGVFRPFLTRVLPVKDAHGKVVRWFGTNTDITEELEIRRRLESSNAELQQFAYITSHDMQEPLRMVVSYLTLLERKHKGLHDPQAQEYIKCAMEGGLRMRNLIDDLLEYSRLDSRGKEFAPVNMNGVLDSTIKQLKISMEESKADIFVGPLPSIMGDEAQMLQLMQNLISNSINSGRRRGR
jgi:PAS domain S-box-containing protein